MVSGQTDQNPAKLRTILRKFVEAEQLRVSAAVAHREQLGHPRTEEVHDVRT